MKKNDIFSVMQLKGVCDPANVQIHSDASDASDASDGSDGSGAGSSL